ncbi:hypothetical protein [Streptomyces sp. NPDC008137]|uniref:hypothetical protein n=1 Tax=Streptomyces sp. NPDC008137 TaxID=3364813 RepID=UPI0036E6B210
MAWTRKAGGHYPETFTSASGDKVTNGYDTSGNMMSQTDTTTGSEGAKWTYDYHPKSGAMDCGGGAARPALLGHRPRGPAIAAGAGLFG